MAPKLRKVFFIDDDEATNVFHKALAQEIGLAEHIDFFQKAEDALDVLKGYEKPEEFPELILVDVNMPGYNGHQFIKELNHMKAFQPESCHVVMLTNSKDIRDVIAADENQVHHYYWKPLDKSSIKQLVQEVYEPKNL